MAPYLVTLAFDRTGWCFHRIALKNVELLCDEFQFKTAPHLALTHGETDVLCGLWWGSVLRLKAALKCRSVVTCVYDGLSWNIDKGSRNQFQLTLNHTDVLAVCNRGFAEQIEAEFEDVPPIMLVEDGVDTELFQKIPLPSKLSLGWTGNSSRSTPGGPPDQKGVEFMRVAAKAAGIPLLSLDTVNGGAWPHTDMAQFYKDVSVYICCSHKEGTPNPVMEAMACGRPIISTPVGLVPQLVTPGLNGYIIPRTHEAWVKTLTELKGMPFPKLQHMGEEARRAIAPAWDWKVKMEQFRAIFREAIRIGNSPKAHEPGARPAPPPAIKAQIKREENSQEIPRPRNAVRRILLISDVPDWAFHQNMRDLEAYLDHKFAFEHWFVTDFLKHSYVPNLYEFDTVFCVYHRWQIMGLLPWDRTVGSLRALWFKPENRLPPSDEDIALVNQFRAFHVVTRQNYDELKAHCPEVTYLTNPVNMKRFPEMTPVKEVVASWNGNATHWPAIGDVKGFSSIIEPAIAKTGVKLEYAEYNTKRLSPAEMPDFYQTASLALCASLYEGASNSTMEAMAAGQALVTTDVGNHREMQEAQLKHYGDTGIVIVDRNIKDFVDVLNDLKTRPVRVREMGELNRREIEDRWSWDCWIDGYEAFLRKGF